MNLTSPAFEHNATLPIKYTCDGENISPPLEWSEIPEDTKSFVLIHDDPDAVGGVWDHWILYDIPEDIRSIPEDSTAGTEGVTSFGKPGYGGACPPRGSGVHRYTFKLYALGSTLELPPGANKSQIEQVMEGYILAEAGLIGRYERSS